MLSNTTDFEKSWALDGLEKSESERCGEVKESEEWGGVELYITTIELYKTTISEGTFKVITRSLCKFTRLEEMVSINLKSDDDDEEEEEGEEEEEE